MYTVPLTILNKETSNFFPSALRTVDGRKYCIITSCATDAMLFQLWSSRQRAFDAPYQSLRCQRLVRSKPSLCLPYSYATLICKNFRTSSVKRNTVYLPSVHAQLCTYRPYVFYET